MSASAVDDDGPLYLGHYRIETTLGQGSYGKVKLATNIKTNQKVALKFIQKVNIKKPVHMARIKREVRLLKLLHHKHIVRLYEVAETNQEIILTMENAGGGELFDYIVAHHHLKEKEARRLFRQIISAVDYCHQNCVIHRDLKPENLLLDQDHNIKIIDFGFANSFDPNGLLGTFCGSPFYASPEMILGKKYVGPEVDVWSMGVILFALVCGHLPFDDANMKKLYQKIVEGHFVCPPYLSSGAVDLITKMITVDSAKRISLEGVKNHPWVLEDYGVPPNNDKPNRTLPTEVDESIVAKLAFYGVDEKTAKEKILTDPKSTAFATYSLLLEKAKRDEEEKAARIAAAAAAAAAGNAVQAGGAGPEKAGENLAAGQPPVQVRTTAKGNRRQTIAATEASTWQNAALQAAQVAKTERDANGANATVPLAPQEPAASSYQEKPTHLVLPTNSASRGPTSAPSASDAGNKAAGIGSPSTTSLSPSVSENQSNSVTGSKNISPSSTVTTPSAAAQSAPPTVLPLTAGSAPPLPAVPPPPAKAYKLRRFSFDETVGSAVHRAAEAVASKFRKKPTESGPLPNSTTNTVLNDSSSTAVSSVPLPTSEPRVVKGLFNVATSTSKPIPEIFAEVRRVLEACNVEYNLKDYVFRCRDVGGSSSTGGATPAILFEIELCRIHKLALYGLNFKRIKGDSWPYKKLANKLSSQLKL